MSVLNRRIHPIVLFTLATISASPAPARAADPVTDALTGGTPHLNMRLRYETADDSVNEEAEALTLRTRLGYTSGSWEGFSAMGEFEDVRTVASVDEYAPLQPGYAVIADPEVTELNQAYLQYKNGPASARYGRQRIILENARFVGNVGWRQDEQTFDATRIDYDDELFDVTAAFIHSVEGITPAFDANTDHKLLHVKAKKLPGGSLTGYGYWLEDDTSGDTLDTFGARYSGSFPVEQATLLLTLEYASQEADTGAAENPEADYALIEGGVSWRGVTVKAAREVLGSDEGNYGFQTPLATKHAFNGWADKFLATPDAGLQDDYVMVGGKLAGITLKGFYHQFSADEGSSDYGDELNLLAARGFGEHYKLGVKYADYTADDFGTDTEKFWLWGEFSF